MTDLEKIELEIRAKQLAAASMVDMRQGQSYSRDEMWRIEETRRNASAALEVLIAHGISIPTPYHIGNAIYAGGHEAVVFPGASVETTES